MKRKDFSVNTVIGSWTILGDAESTRTPKGVSVRRYRCRCTCGKERSVVAASLYRKQSLSCGSTGCGTRSHGFGVAAFDAVVRRYRRGAIKRNLSWSLADDDVKNITSGDCHYCGESASLSSAATCGRVYGDYLYSGIDRKDNTVGYTLGNCVSCCKTCNFAKRDLPYEEFVAWIRKISQHWTM